MNGRDRLDYAGKYLRDYEAKRYTFLERNLFWLDRVQSIIVPTDAEQFADVSFYQAGMDWDKYPGRAVILRIGQNIWADTEFQRNYTEARRRSLAIGGYFFFDGRATPQQQANVIINAMQGKSLELELFIDWEKNYAGASEGLPNVVKLMQLVEAAGVKCKAVGLYSGYYYFTGNSNPTTHATQYAYLKTRPLWLAWYASASVVKVPAPWTTWTHWQFGTPAVAWGQPTAEIDMNKHNGTRAEFTARYLLASIPFGYSKLRRANSDVHVVKLETFRRAHVTDTEGGLWAVSNAAKNYGAQYAVNGDGWYAIEGNRPLSLAASDGDLYNAEQYDFRPFVNISESNSIAISHFPANVTPYNLVSGTRYLVKVGFNAFASSVDPEHVAERHPRTAIGHTVDGKLILCVVDGRSAESAGVTLKELADIMIEAGAYWAIELDGGGSSAMWVEDKIVNVPSGPPVAGEERPVVNHLLIFTENTMARFEAIALFDATRLRADHNTLQPYLSSHPKGTKFHGDTLFVATQELFNADGVKVQYIGDEWLKVTDVNGTAKSGWVAIIHKGAAVCSLVDSQPEPTEKKVTDINIKLAAGSIVTTKYSDGSEKVETA